MTFDIGELSLAAMREQAAAEPEMYYIQNRGFCGNCLSWWRPDGGGYTLNLDRAGRYTFEEAARIVRRRPAIDKAWRCSDIYKVARLHVSIEDLRAADILPLDAAEVKR